MKFIVSFHHRHLRGCGLFQFLLICIIALICRLPIHGGLIHGNPFVFVSHQTTAWFRWRLGHAAVPFPAGITTPRPRSVRNSSSVAAGRTSTTILAWMSASAPALAQVPNNLLLRRNFFIFPCSMMNISEASLLLLAASLCSKSTRRHSSQFAFSTIHAIVMLKLWHDGFMLLVLIAFLFFLNCFYFLNICLPATDQ